MLAATFRRMWGGAIPSSAYKQGIGVAFKHPVIILHVSFRAMSTCPVCLERPHEEQAYSDVEKQSANAVVRTVAVHKLPIWSLLISAEDYFWCLLLLWC